MGPTTTPTERLGEGHHPAIRTQMRRPSRWRYSSALLALFTTDETVVPDLVGVTIEEAADLLEAEGLVLGEVTIEWFRDLCDR